MDYTFEDFIFHKPGALDSETCRSLIETGKSVKDIHYSHEAGLIRNDEQLYMPGCVPLDPFVEPLYKVLQEALDQYVVCVPILNNVNIESHVMKWQKTPPGGGFHQWHTEQGPGSECSRVLVWMIYLNDIYDGGETEFLYQKTRFAPRQGDLVLWPASITHPHRGNPPYKEDKFIVTGWFHYPRNRGSIGEPL